MAIQETSKVMNHWGIFSWKCRTMSNIWYCLKRNWLISFLLTRLEIHEIKTKFNGFIASFGIITLSLFCFVYNIITAKTLVHVGQQNLIPAYMVSVKRRAITWFVPEVFSVLLRSSSNFGCYGSYAYRDDFSQRRSSPFSCAASVMGWSCAGQHRTV